MSGPPKTAIVTGASQGIGAGIVRGFLERGFNVVANSRRMTQSAEVAASDRVALVDGHIGEPATAAKIVETALFRFKSIDALANNAGIFFTKPFTEYTAEDFRSLVSTNLAMCGRYILVAKAKKMAAFLKISLDEAIEKALREPRYNIAPTQAAPFFRRSAEGAPELVSLKWSLLPSWSKTDKPGYSTINAVSETAATKPAFRSAFKKRRGAVPMDGFFEWKKNEDETKTPHFIRRADEEPLGAAGLWERWEKEGEVIESFTILTTEANGFMKALHHRMPAFLAPEDFQAWIDEGPPELLRPCPEDWLTAYPIGKRVNNPRNQGPENIEPAGAPEGA